MKTRSLFFQTLVLLAFLCSCKTQTNDISILSTAEPTQTSLPSTTQTRIHSLSLTNVPTNTTTSTQTATPSLTPSQASYTTPSLTPSLTPIPEDLLEQLRVSFAAVLLVQASAELLNEAAIQRNLDQIDNIHVFGTLLFIGTLIDKLEETRMQANYADILEPYVNNAFIELQSVKDIIVRWVNNKITPDTVVQEMMPILNRINQIAITVDDTLSNELKLDRDLMTEYREDTLDELKSVFEEFDND